jgi:hypothetical protein
MTKTIDITPDVSLLKKSGEVNYRLPHAIAELVDNSIDARKPGRKLTVEVVTGQKGGKKRIYVVDDGVGMSPAEAQKAMVMAYSDKKASAIGEFGLGMKTACSFLGSRFEIVTATAKAKKAVKLVYDEESFLETGKWSIQMEEVDKPFDHGTEINIVDLKVNLYAGVKNAILGHFSKTFKHFLGSGEVEIIVNNDSVVPHHPETIKDYDTELSFEVNGKPVSGWASLATKGSGKGWYGFDLVRHKRVLAQHQKIGFKSGAGVTRMVGELHLDDFPVVNNKTDFRRDTDDWKQLEKLLEEQIVDLVRESRRLANPGASKLEPKDEAEVTEHIEQVKEALKTDELQGDLDRRALDAELADEFSEGPLPFKIAGEGDEEGSPTGTSRPEGDDGDEGETDGGPPESTLQRARLNRVKTQLRNLNIEHSIARLGRGSLYKIWEVQGVGAKKRLVVTTNADHPMYMAMQESFLLWIKHNIVEAVAEFFTEETGNTDAMLLIKSDILKHIGNMQLELDEGEEGDDTLAIAVDAAAS